MNSKMTTNSQLSNTKQNKKILSKQLEWKQTQKWTSHGGLSAGKGRGENGGKGTGNKKHSGRFKIDRRRLKIV